MHTIDSHTEKKERERAKNAQAQKKAPSALEKSFKNGWDEVVICK